MELNNKFFRTHRNMLGFDSTHFETYLFGMIAAATTYIYPTTEVLGLIAVSYCANYTLLYITGELE